MTIFSTPIIRPILSFIAQFFLWLRGWKIEQDNIPPTPKAMLIAVPHTSNWDFMIMMAMALKFKIAIHWIGKDSLFKGVMGPIARWMGGIPVVRSERRNMVQQVADQFKSHDSLYIVIAPEGTRSSVGAWKSGFYHMANEGGVPVLLGYLDGQKKIAGIREEPFYPTGNYDEDIQLIRQFYKPFVGIKKKRHSEIE